MNATMLDHGTTQAEREDIIRIARVPLADDLNAIEALYTLDDTKTDRLQARRTLNISPVTDSHSTDGPLQSRYFPTTLASTVPHTAGSVPEDSDSPEEMTFSSSPVAYPLSSSPPPVPHQKRKLFNTFPSLVQPSSKKTKVVGGFILDDDEDDVPIETAHGRRLLDTIEESIERAESFKQASHVRSSEEREDEARPRSPSLPPILLPSQSRLAPKNIQAQTCAGATINIPLRKKVQGQSYEEIIAQRSTTAAGRAKTAYYGIDIHKLVDDAKLQREIDQAAVQARQEREAIQSIETPVAASVESQITKQHTTHQMWTEKYRAKKFTELVGDERTHRQVLRWLKSWDSVVFPGSGKSKPKKIFEDRDKETQHRKILLLTGPPGLGKTTLAHVCARQAGYEVLEINASDDRSRDVVKGRIKDALGTETVRGIQEHGKSRRAGRPVCVVVDEVDGVVTGSSGSGGEGGFMKALLDLVQIDQRNSNGHSNKTKKGDRFRLMRPLIMICNDVYAPSLRPLRQSSMAEVIHVRKPPIEKVILRLKTVFEKEYITCDNDAVRRLCESTWGIGTRKQNSLGGRAAGEGDIRTVLVQGEWIAHKLRGQQLPGSRLTRKWIESHLEDNSSNANQKGLGRGGVREVVERVFLEGAGLPNLPTILSTDEARLVAASTSNSIGVADLRKRKAILALREMIDTCGDHDRLVTDCFSTYPSQSYQDDNFLSKPNEGYDWLHFHDRLSSKVYGGQEWELGAYLSTAACGFHDLFAAVDKGARGWDDKAQAEDAETDVHPFSGPKADFSAYEAEKANRVVLTEMQGKFSAPLLRLFSSVDAVATELVPNLGKMLTPDVKPVVVGGSGSMASVASVRKESERTCVKASVQVMHAVGIDFEKVRVEHEGGGSHPSGGYALRMEPPIDLLNTYHVSSSTSTTGQTTTVSKTVQPPAPVRYAIRQVLAQELQKERLLQSSLARQARLTTPSKLNSSNLLSKANDHESNKENILKPNGTNISIDQLVASTRAPSTTAGAPVKKDFFGRPIITPSPSPLSNIQPDLSLSSSKTHIHTRKPSFRHEPSSSGRKEIDDKIPENQRTWVSFHEGYSNAVRKFISLGELMDGF